MRLHCENEHAAADRLLTVIKTTSSAAFPHSKIFKIGYRNRIEILPLADFPQAIPAIATWIHDEWGTLEAIPAEEIEAGLRRNSGFRTIPTTFVAISNNKPIGTVSLDTTDLAGFDHLGPWLASLYVEPGFRRLGIGTRLLNHAVDHARKLGVRPIWLWTMHDTAFFEKHGWKKSGEAALSGNKVKLMKFG